VRQPGTGRHSSTPPPSTAEEDPMLVGVERAQPGKRWVVVRPASTARSVEPPQHLGQPGPGRDAVRGQVQNGILPAR
jgi:hypothetical protein